MESQAQILFHPELGDKCSLAIRFSPASCVLALLLLGGRAGVGRALWVGGAQPEWGGSRGDQSTPGSGPSVGGALGAPSPQGQVPHPCFPCPEPPRKVGSCYPAGWGKKAGASARRNAEGGRPGVGRGAWCGWTAVSWGFGPCVCIVLPAPRPHKWPCGLAQTPCCCGQKAQDQPRVHIPGL